MKRIQGKQSVWRRVTGVISDRSISARLLQLAMLYGVEGVPDKKTGGSRIEDLFSLGAIRLDKIKNKHVSGTVHIR